MKSMLIAAWSEIFAEELAKLFQNEYRTITCSRGDDALQILQELKPDILIICLTMPYMTGLEVLQQTKYTPPVIVALTNYFSDAVAQEAQAAGVGALIRLPCSFKYIISHLKKLDTT